MQTYIIYYGDVDIETIIHKQQSFQGTETYRSQAKENTNIQLHYIFAQGKQLGQFQAAISLKKKQEMKMIALCQCKLNECTTNVEFKINVEIVTCLSDYVYATYKREECL